MTLQKALREALEETQRHLEGLVLGKAQLEMDAASQMLEAATNQAEASSIGLAHGQRPSTMYGPLLPFYDDVSAQWAVTYGVVSEQLAALLPSHITETGLTAYGSCMEEALRNFDKLWLGKKT
jgi:hypothetical protein